jgi:hypothetical protein
MIRGVLFAVAFAGCSVMAGVSVSDDATPNVRVETSVGADSVTVGQRLRISYAATYPDSLTLLPPGGFDPGNCRLISVRWREDANGAGKVKQADVIVLPMDLESAHIPPAPFLFLLPSGDTLVALSDEVDVPIRQMTNAESDSKPLKPQWTAPRSYLPYLLIAGLVLLLAGVALWLWKRRKRVPVVEAPPPELPADYVALKALAEIESMKLLGEGQFKKYYTLVVDALRHYLERRFGIQTMDRTTDEILFDLGDRRLRVDGLEDLLREADLVKFAKYIPDSAAGEEAMRSARDIVAKTTPVPVTAERDPVVLFARSCSGGGSRGVRLETLRKAVSPDCGPRAHCFWYGETPDRAFGKHSQERGHRYHVASRYEQQHAGTGFQAAQPSPCRQTRNQ